MSSEPEHTEKETSGRDRKFDKDSEAVEEFAVSDERDDEPIEGGDIKDLDETSVKYFNRERHEANTARRLAYLFVGVLTSFFVLHYIATFAAALWLASEMQETLQNIFHAGLPVLSGLAGAAATYFFIRRD